VGEKVHDGRLLLVMRMNASQPHRNKKTCLSRDECSRACTPLQYACPAITATTVHAATTAARPSACMRPATVHHHLTFRMRFASRAGRAHQRSPHQRDFERIFGLESWRYMLHPPDFEMLRVVCGRVCVWCLIWGVRFIMRRLAPQPLPSPHLLRPCNPLPSII